MKRSDIQPRIAETAIVAATCCAGALGWLLANGRDFEQEEQIVAAVAGALLVDLILRSIDLLTWNAQSVIRSRDDDGEGRR